MELQDTGNIESIPPKYIQQLASQSDIVRGQAAELINSILGHSLNTDSLLNHMLVSKDIKSALGYILYTLQSGLTVEWEVLLQVYVSACEYREEATEFADDRCCSLVTRTIMDIIAWCDQHSIYTHISEYNLMAGNEKRGVGDIDGSIGSYLQMTTLGDSRGYHNILDIYRFAADTQGDLDFIRRGIALCDIAYSKTGDVQFLIYSIRFYTMIDEPHISRQIYARLEKIVPASQLQPYIVYSEEITSSDELSGFSRIVEDHYAGGSIYPSISIKAIERSAIRYIHSHAGSLVQDISSYVEETMTKGDQDEDKDKEELYMRNMIEYLSILQFNVFVLQDELTPRYLVSNIWKMYNLGGISRQILKNFFAYHLPESLTHIFTVSTFETTLISYIIAIRNKMSPGYQYDTQLLIQDIIDTLQPTIEHDDISEGYSRLNILQSLDNPRENSLGISRVVHDSWNVHLIQCKLEYGVSYVAQILNYARRADIELSTIRDTLKIHPDIALAYLFERFLAGIDDQYTYTEWQSIVQDFGFALLPDHTKLLFAHFLMEREPRCTIDLLSQTDNIFEIPEACVIALLSLARLSVAEQDNILDRLDKLAQKQYGVNDFTSLTYDIADAALSDTGSHSRNRAFSHYSLFIAAPADTLINSWLEHLNLAARLGYEPAIYHIVSLYLDVGEIDQAIHVLEYYLLNPTMTHAPSGGLSHMSINHEGAYMSKNPNLGSKKILTTLIRILIQVGKFDRAISYIHLGFSLNYNMRVHMLGFLLYSKKIQEAAQYYIIHKDNIPDEAFDNFIPGFFEEFGGHNYAIQSIPVSPDDTDGLSKQLASSYILATHNGWGDLNYLELYQSHWNSLRTLLSHCHQDVVFEYLLRMIPIFCQDDPVIRSSMDKYISENNIQNDRDILYFYIHTYSLRLYLHFLSYCDGKNKKSGSIDLKNQSKATRKFIISRTDEIIDIFKGLPDGDKYIVIIAAIRFTFSVV